MAQSINSPCPNCGATYHLTAQYLAQYGGQMTTCTNCQRNYTLPTSAALGAAPAGPPPVPVMSTTPVLSYSSPQMASQNVGGVWRERKVLVAANGASLPPCCIKCNEPVDEPMTRKTFYWHPPAVYFGLLMGLLPYAILALVLRKSGTIHLGLCKKHKSRRLWNILGGVGASVLSVVVFIIAGQTNTPELIAVGIIMLIGGLVWAIVASRMLTPTRIDGTTLWLRGACTKMLDTLPGAPGHAPWGAPGGYQQPQYGAYPPA